MAEGGNRCRTSWELTLNPLLTSAEECTEEATSVEGGGGMGTPARISDAWRKLLIGQDSDCGVSGRDSGVGVWMRYGVSDWGVAVTACGRSGLTCCDGFYSERVLAGGG